MILLPARIKRLGQGDEELLIKLLEAFKPGDTTGRHLRQLLCLKDLHLIAAIREANPVGFLLGYELPRLSTIDRMLFIYELEVAAEVRRQGIGRMLINAALSYCHYHGFSKAFVITETSNAAACRLYESAGGRRPRHDDAVFTFDTRGGA